METPQGVLEAIATVVGAVARGTITPSEGQALASLIETQRKAIENWCSVGRPHSTSVPGHLEPYTPHSALTS